MHIFCITLPLSSPWSYTVYHPGIHLRDTLVLSLAAYPSSGWHGFLAMGSSTFTTPDSTSSMATSSELVHILYLDENFLNTLSLSLGPNELSIRDVDAINPIMGPNGLPKGPRQSIDEAS